jgi:hypothetical protein
VCSRRWRGEGSSSGEEGSLMEMLVKAAGEGSVVVRAVGGC